VPPGAVPPRAVEPPAPPAPDAPRPPGRAAAPRPAKKPAAKGPEAPGKAASKVPQRVAAPPDPLVGKTLGRCLIEAPIGQGRTARVYRARHKALETTVAVKVLLPEFAARPTVKESFLREARAIAQIDNENVVKVYDVATDGELNYLVMELLEGESVLDLIEREERIDVMDSLRIVRQAAHGLAAAHARNIVHRDVKPQNLVLLEDGTVKVVDFGLAAEVVDAAQRVGTPHYMAPEVCSAGQAEERSDIYALGIVLYHLLVGQPPYAGLEVRDILQAHIRGTPLQPGQRRPGLPKEVSELVRTLTNREASQRPTAAEVVAALDAFGGKALKEKDSLKRRTARGRAASARARSKGPLVLASGLVLAVLVALVALGSGGGDEKPTTTAGGTTPTAPGETPVVRPPIERPPPPAVLSASQLQEQREREAAARLTAVELFARETWKGPDDTPAVVSRYDTIRTELPDTEAGKEADRRVRMIRGGKLHPHPDQEYAAEEAVVGARAQWEATEPVVRELIAKHEYLEARRKVPESVQDASGGFAQEMRYWRTYLDHLVQFQTNTLRRAPELDEKVRTIPTPQGKGAVNGSRGNSFVVRLESGEEVVVPWGDVAPKDLVRVGLASARRIGGMRPHLGVMAYAFTQSLWDPFSEADYEVEFAGGAGDQAFVVAAWKERFPGPR
jgi:serine/threonine-protein kinase